MATLYYKGNHLPSPHPPPPTGNIKKNNQEKNRNKINPLLFDSLPSCWILIYNGNLKS